MKRRFSIAILLSLLLAWGVVTYATPPTTVRVYDVLYSVSGLALQDCKVTAELINRDSAKVAYDSVSGFSLGKSPLPFDTSTSSTGYVAIPLIPNKFIIPHGSVYAITVKYNGKIVYSVKINITQTDSVRIRDCLQ